MPALKKKDNGKQKQWSGRDSKYINAALFVLPAVLLVTVFLVYPIILSFKYSFTDWNGVSEEYHLSLIHI